MFLTVEVEPSQVLQKKFPTLFISGKCAACNLIM